jgi:phosphatidylserine/phosphatidylglycerophosphate/cardiolipin synthase-like enzyme
MMLKHWLCLLSLVLSPACSDDGNGFSPGTDGPLPPRPDAEACRGVNTPRPTPLVVGVLPGDGEKPYIDVIESATKTIRVYIYTMGYGGIFDALKQKAGAGIDVRVLFDKGQTANQKYYSELKSAGADVMWSDAEKYTHMHAKVIMADDKKAIISTGNFSYTYSIKKNRDYVATTTDPEDLADLISLYDADWNRGAPLLPCTRLLISPINARMRIKQLIESAKSTLDVQSMQFAETEVRDAVAARKKAGVDVRVLMADPFWVNTNTAAANFLGTQGIPARFLTDPGMHAKAIIVDGKQAYLGSINLSFTSLNKNREVGVVVLDATQVQRMSTTFEKDWSNAKTF